MRKLHRNGILSIILTFVLIVLAFPIIFDTEKELPVSTQPGEIEEDPGEDEGRQEPLWRTGSLLPFSTVEVRPGRDIFFLQLSGWPNITYREACVAESAASHHPNKNIFIIFTGQFDAATVEFSEALALIASFSNIKLRYIPVADIFKKTYLWNWFIYSNWQKSKDTREQSLQLAITLVLMHKLGGIFLTWDSLCLGPVLDSSLGRCGEELVTTEVLALPPKHTLLLHILQKLEADVTSVQLTRKGITAELKSFCKVDSLIQLNYVDCKNLDVRVLESEAYCPVEENKFWILYDSKRNRLASAIVAQSATRVLNLGLAGSGGYSEWASPSFQSVIFHLAGKHCPGTFIAADSTL